MCVFTFGPSIQVRFLKIFLLNSLILDSLFMTHETPLPSFDYAYQMFYNFQVICLNPMVIDNLYSGYSIVFLCNKFYKSKSTNT